MLDATSSSFVQYLYVLLIYKYKYYFLLNQYVIDQHLAYYLLIKIHYTTLNLPPCGEVYTIFSIM